MRFCFQYPPSGSSRCNPLVAIGCWSPFGPFSTLQAGRVAATCANRASALPPLQLSVPSKRVESLQRFVVYERSVDDGAFQYPPSGSSRCNRESVLQQHKTIYSFSTLHAGRAAAPYSPGLPIAGEQCFQYPPSGSSRCNTTTRCPTETRNPFFQYPPSGSSRCNKTFPGYRILISQ